MGLAHSKMCDKYLQKYCPFRTKLKIIDIRVNDTFDNQLDHFLLNSQNALCFTRVISGITDMDVDQHQSIHRHQALVNGCDVTVF